MAGEHTQAGKGILGARVPRKEDARLVTGGATFLDDLRLPGMVHVKVLRSPHAHARIKAVDTSAAVDMPGVLAVMTGADLVGKVNHWGARGQGLEYDECFPMAIDRAIHAGQEIAAVAATSAYAAWDAVEQIHVDYERLPAAIDLVEAVSSTAPLVHPDGSYQIRIGNAYHHFRVRVGDTGHSRKTAESVVRARFRTIRQHGNALEAHGCVADYNRGSGRLTVWTSTQSVFMARDLLSMVLGMPAHLITVKAVDVGAGFGSKTGLFPHEVIAALFAIRLERPVKLMLTREEVMRSTHARLDQVRDVELHTSGEGTITGWDEYVINNAGAASMLGNMILMVGTSVALSTYPFPNVHIDGLTTHTHTQSGGALRGFGVPQTVWAMEQLVDMAAHELQIDPIEFRKRNVFGDEECPKTTPMGQIVESIALRECLDAVAEASNWSRRNEARADHVGYGVACCLKHTSGRYPVGGGADLSSARIKIETDGSVTVVSSDVPHGQGHETMLSQIVAEELGVSLERITVVSADTDRALYGRGTYGSRGAAILGGATFHASVRLREKLFAIAAHLMECDPADLTSAEDRVFVVGSPETGMAIGEVARVAAMATLNLPSLEHAGSIAASYTYDAPGKGEFDENGRGNLTASYSGAAHVGVVSVDVETGEWQIEDYYMAADSGNVVNPLIVEGQHQGAFLHGYEWVRGQTMRYSDEGVLETATFADYPALYATEVPSLPHVEEHGVPSRVFPGGRKGAGESATSLVAPVIANALFDAIGIRFVELPITPDKVLAALAEKKRLGVDELIWPPQDDGPRPDWDLPEEGPA